MEGINESNRYLKYEQARELAFDILKKTVKPEFLNRVDDTIMFLPLRRNEVKKIVQLQFERIKDRLKYQGFDIEITEEGVDWLASVGFDPQYGARPIKRALQQYILNDISKMLLSFIK